VVNSFPFLTTIWPPGSRERGRMPLLATVRLFFFFKITSLFLGPERVRTPVFISPPPSLSFFYDRRFSPLSGGIEQNRSSSSLVLRSTSFLFLFSFPISLPAVMRDLMWTFSVPTSLHEPYPRGLPLPPFLPSEDDKALEDFWFLQDCLAPPPLGLGKIFPPFSEPKSGTSTPRVGSLNF